MKRVLGLDVGDKTIGVAVSDPLGLTAQGITTIRRTNIENDFNSLKDIINKYEIKLAVIGLPKNMNNTIGPQGEKVLEFVEYFKEKFDIEVILEDERLTTAYAERILINGDMSRKKRKKVIDKVAATYILQSYLDRTR
ncbi:Holliday junction resolvase RuvX [Caldisalinibacter kiritimatiensis]|uniref:Putative pre-16S rRNA nuclease n=1 Tax=Caldisalinibacter kiritimatiensis TaxID=1304284 RepID=R1CCC7_9FIRM|nr:Holliday junction resolvase RuvX [Caldisalinibacter kiritimatiensis]EOC99949.1 Putative Holliday junction resolvase [Caldisalinibacter kiritimatiensis]